MKKKTKIKIKLNGIIIVLAVIVLATLVFFYFRSLRVTNIYVTGNNLLKEYEIIELANLSEYPKLDQVSTKKIESDLLKNPIINKVNVSKSLSGKVVINIYEARVIGINKDERYLLSTGEEIEFEERLLGIPLIVNDLGEMKDKFANKLIQVDEDIQKRISEILYQPTELDNERFLFYMNDGNYVYITLNKINLINSYNEIYPTLEGKKGILYLDSGNHFEIKKNNK